MTINPLTCFHAARVVQDSPHKMFEGKLSTEQRFGDEPAQDVTGADATDVDITLLIV